MKNITYKKNFLRMCGVMVCAMISAPTMANEGVNDIKFPLINWSKKLLNIVDAGPYILSRDEVFDVASPPLNDSEVTKGELKYLLEIEKTERSENNISRIMYENDGGKAHDFFVKEGLIAEDNNKTISLMILIDNDHSYFILERKKHFARPRPSQLENSLDLVIENPKHAAYPSGHASQTYIVALVLSDFDPENAELYKKFAIEVAHRREIAGVHYPSDSEAGRKLAVDVLARLREVDIFEKKFQDAKESYTKPNLTPHDGEVAMDKVQSE